jgi:hypothetical protein
MFDGSSGDKHFAERKRDDGMEDSTNRGDIDNILADRYSTCCLVKAASLIS